MFVMIALAVVLILLILFLPSPHKRPRPTQMMVIEMRQGPPDNFDLPEFHAYDRAVAHAMEVAAANGEQFTFTPEMVQLYRTYTDALEHQQGEQA